MTPPPATPSTPPSQSASCLRGCLVLILLVVFCTAGSLIAAQTVGRAYVARHLPSWERRYPWLALAIDLFELRGQLATEAGQLAGGLDRRSGANDKSLLPANVAVYPEPMDEIYSISADRVSGFQRVSGSPEPVITYFRREMPARGWTLASERQNPGVTVLTWTGETGHCRTEIVALDHTSEIWLRCTLPPP